MNIPPLFGGLLVGFFCFFLGGGCISPRGIIDIFPCLKQNLMLAFSQTPIEQGLSNFA